MKRPGRMGDMGGCYQCVGLMQPSSGVAFGAFGRVVNRCGRVRPSAATAYDYEKAGKLTTTRPQLVLTLEAKMNWEFLIADI